MSKIFYSNAILFKGTQKQHVAYSVVQMAVSASHWKRLVQLCKNDI